MRYIISVILLAAFLTITSCDRFENTFQPDGTESSFLEKITLFEETLPTSLLASDIVSLMEFYSDDYLNNGWTKADVEQYFSQLSTIVTDQLVVEIVDTNQSQLSFSYRIDDNEAGVDTLIVEFTDDEDTEFIFIGNQQGEEVSDESKVLVELFTATWCPNCPYVEAALFDLKGLYGDKFYYIEYHIMDQLDFGHSDILNYYQLSTTLPVGIVQGQLSITGGSAANSYDEYHFAISQYWGEDEQFGFEEFDYSVVDGQLIFSILVATEVEDLNDINIRYALIEKESDVDNAAGQPSKNVVIAKGNESLTGNTTDELVLDIPNFEFSDPRLVIWIQTMDDPYESETSRIHNVIEYQISIP